MLIKFCIIPLKINQSEKTTSVTFKYRSKQALIFLFYQFIITGVVMGFMVIYMTGINKIMAWYMAYFQRSNIIDFISFMILVMLLNCVPNFSLPFAKHLTYVANGLILSPNLQLPNHWKKIVFSSLVYAISSAIYIYVCNSNAFKN